jgi:hypothetical protein
LHAHVSSHELVVSGQNFHVHAVALEGHEHLLGIFQRRIAQSLGTGSGASLFGGT